MPRYIRGTLTLTSWTSAHTMMFAKVMYNLCARAIRIHLRRFATKNYGRIVASTLILYSSFLLRITTSLRLSTTIRLLQSIIYIDRSYSI